MTAVVGFITQGGIVIGTDSQMTDVSAGFKSVDATKIFEVSFKGGASVVLARAGSIEGSDMFHQEFEHLAAETEIDSDRAVANTAATALAAVKARLQASIRGLLSPKQKQQYIEDRGHGFLIAYAYRGVMVLLEGNANRPIPTKTFKPPTAIGSGAYVGLNALKGIDTEALSFQEGVGWAAYAVEMAKESDPYCSGYTQIGCVAKDGNVEVFEPDLGRTVSSLIGSVISEMRERLGKKIKTEFRDVPIALTDAEATDEIDRLLQKHLKRRRIS